MGITGGYAGQLFGLLVGFGIAMLKKSLTDKTLIDGKIEFKLFAEADENLLDIVVIFAALFALCNTLVIMCTILLSPPKIPIIVDPMTIKRDMVFYILSTLTIIAFGFYQKLTWWTSVIMLGIYVLLVLVVAW